MPYNDHQHLLFAAGLTNGYQTDKYSRMLDAVIAYEGIGVDDVVGVGERGTGNNDLYVVHRQAIAFAYERGIFNKRIEVTRVCPVASIANLRATQEGFKGSDVVIRGTDRSGAVVLEIEWGLGGPDWVEPAVKRQVDHLFAVISEAMDKLGEGPRRASVASASSKSGALMDWAADVVKAAGVDPSGDVVEEHADMIAGSIRMWGFLRLGAERFGYDSLADFYPNGEMPDGTPFETFDDVYEHVVARIGNRAEIDHLIDETLADAYVEFVNGCRETYAA